MCASVPQLLLVSLPFGERPEVSALGFGHEPLTEVCASRPAQPAM